MTPQDARAQVLEALAQVAPDADLPSLAPDTDFRDELELDSLDYLNFVETLTELSGYRIEEDDYPKITTVAGTASFLAERA